MIKIGDNIRILETSLCPSFCDVKTAEKFIAAMQYQDFLKQEIEEVDCEIKEICMSIEKQISGDLPQYISIK